MAATRPLTETCPRVVGVVDQQLVTCGHPQPCPDHGDPIIRFVSPACEPPP